MFDNTRNYLAKEFVSEIALPRVRPALTGKSSVLDPDRPNDFLDVPVLHGDNVYLHTSVSP
jgi:hypothetical protein